MAKFKGGPIYLNSGGFGPDDYLLKPIKGGRWVRVNFQFGRNFTGDKEEAKRERALMEEIFPIAQFCVGDMQRRWLRGQGKIPVMTATEFWEKYKNSQDWTCVYGRTWRTNDGERIRL